MTDRLTVLAWRFCRELQMLAVDFGFDVLDGWEDALRESRRGWRERQLAALVRDMPDVAAEALADLDYAITEPGRRSRAESAATGRSMRGDVTGPWAGRRS